MPIHQQVPRTHSCFPEARASLLRLPEAMRIGGKGSSKCATSCSKDRALLVLGVADQAGDQAADRVADRVEEDSAVAEVDLVGEEDSAVVGEDLGAAAQDLEVAAETGREAERE